MDNLRSIWDGTKTYFPLLKEKVKGKSLDICIVGASDGRFVIPLALNGHKVLAIENDPMSLDGCFIEINGSTKQYLGIVEKVKNLNLEKSVTISESSFMDFQTNNKFDVVFTSSSWDCGKNDGTVVEDFVKKMQNLVKQDGILCAEYMMKFEEIHLNNPNLLEVGEINKFFNNDWEILDEFYTSVFNDIPHIKKLTIHKHKMGFIMLKKLT